jgi:hypothetical protein
MPQAKARYKIGDEVLRLGRDGIRLGRIVDVLSVVVGKPAAYQVRVRMVTHIEDENNLRPVVRRSA